MAAASPSCARAASRTRPATCPPAPLSSRRSLSPASPAAAAAAFPCRAAASPRLLALLLILSLAVVRTHSRAPAISVADVRHHSQVADHVAASQSPETEVVPPRRVVGEAAAAAGSGSDQDGAESAIAEWVRRSAEAGARFLPLQRAEDAPSREEVHRRILQESQGIGGGFKKDGERRQISRDASFLPELVYDDTLVATVNGSVRNTLVNYSTFANDTIRLPVYPYYVQVRLGSQRQLFTMALNLFLPFTWVPCDCVKCGTMRVGTPYSRPFSTLSSYSLNYISCTDQRCSEGASDTSYGCNADGAPNYFNLTDWLPGDDALCVYGVGFGDFDYYEADVDNNDPILSVGHVVEDTVHLTAPDGTEVNRTITFGCLQGPCAAFISAVRCPRRVVAPRSRGLHPFVRAAPRSGGLLPVREGCSPCVRAAPRS
ncbi:hypothetical protein CLOM_g18122 [Closterium sp. NIES-68]|nr:hypothetical protein CLOM_g18122 [Closterium sp. NIES-68]